MQDRYAQRRERLKQQIKRDGLDGLLITSEVNVSYLTGFSGDSTYLALTPDRAWLISDGRYTTQISEECPGLEAHIRPPSQALPEAAGEVLHKLGLHAVEFDSTAVTVAQFQALSEHAGTVQWKGRAGRVEELRAVKDESELAEIRAAIAMAERAFGMFRAMLRGKDTEKELADDLEMYIRRAGGKCGSFPPIVAGGPRAALPHAQPTAHRADEEGLLLVDWGASGRFYKSDLTRVLVRRTNATSHLPSGEDFLSQLQKIYRVVLEAQRRAIEAVRPGARAGDVDAAARRVISDAGFGDRFSHSVGHGIGLQVHEAPLLKPGSDLEIKAGMVVTVEPGIYLPGWGGVRIEDDVLVTEDGRQVLTSVPKEFEAQFVEY